MANSSLTNLTEIEISRLTEILGRKPNNEELRCFSVLWTERFTKKASIKFLKRLLHNGENIFTGFSNSGYLEIEDEKLYVHVRSMLKEKKSKGENIEHLVYKNLAMNQSIPNCIINHVWQNWEIQEKTHHEFANKQTVVNELINQTHLSFLESDISLVSFQKNCSLESSLGIGIISNPGEANQKIENEGNKLIMIFKNKPQKEKEFGQSIEIIEALYKINSVIAIQSLEVLSLLEAIVKICFNQKSGIQIQTDKIKSKHNDPIDAILDHYSGYLLILINKDKQKEVSELLKEQNYGIWDVGLSTQSENFQFYFEDEILIDFPFIAALTGVGVPFEEKKYSKPEEEYTQFLISQLPLPESFTDIAHGMIQAKYNKGYKILKSSHIDLNAEKIWFEKYPFDSSIISTESSFNLIISSSFNNKRIKPDLQQAAAIAFFEAAMKNISTGGKVHGAVVSFYLGSENDPNVFWQFVEATKGINKVSRVLNIPVIASDIRFTADFDRELPIIKVNIIGSLPKDEKPLSFSFKNKGDMIFLVGESRSDFAASLYLESQTEFKNSLPPYFGIEISAKLYELAKYLIKNKIVNSLRDVAEGGVYLNLVESGMENKLGFDITSDAEIRMDAYLFGESKNRLIVTVSGNKETEFIDFMIDNDFPFSTLGHVTKGEIRVDDISFGFIKDTAELIRISAK